jgi:hypothetical protein
VKAIPKVKIAMTSPSKGSGIAPEECS